MKRNKYLLLLFATCLLLSCNTDIELCNESEHPHRSNLTFKYNWQKTNAFTPKDMSVLAHRVINQWKGAMKVNSLDGTGTYIFNAPEGAENDTVKTFKVPAGDYRFITFSMESDEFDCANVDAYFNDPTINLKELNISYHTYAKKDKGLKFVINNWVDYNNYSRYLQPSTKALYYDTLTTRKITSQNSNTVTFTPKELTQHVDLSFDIKKVNSVQPFRIDSVYAELSGLVNTINLATCNLTVDKTYKMMFPMENPNDNDNTKIVTCHSEIHVLGIMCSQDKSLLYGPGIMQVMIYCSATDPTDGQRKSKRFQGEINLYNTLKTTPSLKLSNDKEHAVITKQKLTLKVNADMSIDGEKIIEATDEGGGLDMWKNASGDPQIIDI